MSEPTRYEQLSQVLEDLRERCDDYEKRCTRFATELVEAFRDYWGVGGDDHRVRSPDDTTSRWETVTPVEEALSYIGEDRCWGFDIVVQLLETRLRFHYRFNINANDEFEVRNRSGWFAIPSEDEDAVHDLLSREYHEYLDEWQRSAADLYGERAAFQPGGESSE